jgi:hypothetical protein
MAERTDVLETALRSLASRIELPDPPAIAPTVGARLRADAARTHRPPFPGTALWSRRRLVIAIAIGLLLLGGAAVAARLAIGTVEIRIVPTLAPSASAEAPAVFGDEVSLRDAVGATGIKPGWPPALGAPDDVYVVRSEQGPNAMVLGWRSGDGSPTIPRTPWTALLFEMRGNVDIVTKYVLADSIHLARVDDERAFWITGEHDLGLSGAFGGEVVRVSGHVLVWERSGGITYRLETPLPKGEAIALAESLGP